MQDLRFRFNFVSARSPVNWFGIRGGITLDGISCGMSRLPYDRIRSVSIRDGLLVLGLESPPEDHDPILAHLSPGNYLVLQLLNVDAEEAKRLINGFMSTRTAADTKARLAAEGREVDYRCSDCPSCGTRVDLSGLPITPFIGCPTCHSVFYTDGNGTITEGDAYRCCQQCDMFAHVRAHQVVHCYFFGVTNQWTQRRRHLCDSCAWKAFRFTLLRNAPFLLGMPATLTIPLRILRGRDRRLRALGKANHLALRGKVDRAVRLYQAMRQKLPEHPGLLYDEAVANLTAGESSRAFDILRRSLEACANYGPAHRLLNRIENVIDGTA